MNMSFYKGGQQIICTEILSDIIDEMRRERKFVMAIQNPNDIKGYIEVDIESVRGKDES